MIEEYLPYLNNKLKNIFSGEDVRVYSTGKLIHLFPDRVGTKNFYNTECNTKAFNKKWVKRMPNEEIMKLLYEKEGKLCDICFSRFKAIKKRKEKSEDLLDFLVEEGIKEKS